MRLMCSPGAPLKGRGEAATPSRSKGGEGDTAADLRLYHKSL